MQEVNIIGNSSIICSDNVRKQNFQSNIVIYSKYYMFICSFNRNFIFKKKYVKRKYQHVELKFIYFLFIS